MQETNPYQREAEEVDIKSLVFRYLRYWYLFLIGVIVSGSIAWLYLRYSTPEYNISSTLLIKDDKKGPSLSDNTVFTDLALFQTSKNINNEIQLLKSKSLMQRVLKELDLYTSYYKEGDIKTTEIYGENVPIKVIVHQLDSTARDVVYNLSFNGNNQFTLQNLEGTDQSTHHFGKEIQKPIGRFTLVDNRTDNDADNKSIKIRFHNLTSLANSYNGRLTVNTVNKEASVLSISMVDPIPQKGIDIINTLIEVYNKEAVEDKNQIAANTIEFIDERLKFLTTELTEVERNVEQYKQRHDLTNVSSEAALYLQMASEYNRQLSEIEIRLDVLSSIEDYLKNQESQYELVPSSLVFEDQTLNNLVMKFNELQLGLQRMLRTTQPGNPLVENMNEQLANLKENILENISNIQNSLEITKRSLAANSRQFESRIQQIPSIERELLEISRQQGIKESLYLYLLQKREESALSLAATVSNSRVIDSATAGGIVKPKRQLIYLVALFLGLGLPFSILYIKELLNDKIQKAQDIERATKTPILGEISHKKTDELLVVTQDNKSPVAELFRLIRANLQFATAGKANKVILVTSSMSGEGKTFFSVNLAASLVLSGKTVVVLDFDFRKPGLTRSLNGEQTVGITNYLVSDHISMEDIIVPSTALSGLEIIGSGPVPPNPGELMLMPKIGELIEALKERFDFIILDTSPVGQVADALSLAAYADSSLYLVRYNYTYKEQLKIIDDIYQTKKIKSPMIVLNDAKKGNTYGYGYGYGYGHGYGGYGYGEEQKGTWKGWWEKIRS